MQPHLLKYVCQYLSMRNHSFIPCINQSIYKWKHPFHYRLIDYQHGEYCHMSLSGLCAVHGVGIDIKDESSHSKHVIMSHLLFTDPTKDTWTYDCWLICWAAKNYYGEVVRFLVADPRIHHWEHVSCMVSYLSEKGESDSLRLFLFESGVEFSADDALFYSSGDGHAEIVRLLLADEQYDPSSSTADNALIAASSEGDTEIVRLLLDDDRVRQSVENPESIHWASGGGFVDVVELLVEAFAGKLSRVARDAAILEASKFAHVDVVRVLLNADLCDE